MKKLIRPIAIYLPQYHPVPENDKWWGKGFTEWTNVVKGTPRFIGHYQPHLPADLGFYDLRIPEVREAQAELAREHGIYGFCYYHYWFNGRRILERPFNEVLESGKPDFPFCLCWANENWTRAWNGSEQDVLLRQDYSLEDDQRHIEYLLTVFKDKRYIRVDGKPLIIIYKPDLFPDVKATINVFREAAKSQGEELYICRFERWLDIIDDDTTDLGFDAAIEFQPLSKSYKKYVEAKSNSQKKKQLLSSLMRRVVSLLDSRNVPENYIEDYSDFLEFDLVQDLPEYKCYPGVSPMWDNSSRREKNSARIFHGSTPELFGNWYRGKCEKFQPYSAEENFIFINAWNEWAEGNHLEPCEKWGLEYLRALSRNSV